MESPLDRQMAAIKDKADLMNWCSNLADDVDGIILVTNPSTGRVTVRHLGKITLPPISLELGVIQTVAYSTMTDATRGLTIPAVLRLLGAIGPDYQGFITCPSPDHPDRHPSTHITPDQRGWKCFACNAQGGVLDIIVCYGFAEDRKAAAAWLEEISA